MLSESEGASDTSLDVGSRGVGGLTDDFQVSSLGECAGYQSRLTMTITQTLHITSTCEAWPEVSECWHPGENWVLSMT